MKNGNGSYDNIIKTTPCPICETAAFGTPTGIDVDVHPVGYSHGNSLK